MVAPGGEWDFTLIDAAWKVSVGDAFATDESSQTTIKQVLEDLNGQTLATVEWREESQLVLTFLEGGEIQAGPSLFHDPDGDMWWLFHTGVSCMTVDGQGMYQVHSSIMG